MPNGQGIIDEVLGQGVVEEIRVLTEAVVGLRTEYRTTVKEITAGMATLASATGVKGVTEAVEKQNKALDELSKTKEQIVKYEEKINAAMTVEAQLLAQQKSTLQQLNQEHKEAAKTRQAAAGSIDAMKLKLKELEKQINAVGDAEGKGALQVKGLIDQYNKLDGTVRKYQQSMGNYTKSVGNYATGFNGMNLAVGQLVRELPNAGISLQTFLVSISNNIGGLQDAITGLRAEGATAGGVLSAFGKSLFGWQTILMVGVTLVTAYSGKIAEWASKLVSLNSAQKDFNETMAKGRKDATDDLVMLDSLYKKTQDLSISTEARTKAVQRLQEMFPAYFGNISTENMLNGEASGLYKQLRDDIINVAKAKAVQQKITDIINGDMEEQLELEKKLHAAQATAAANKGQSMGFAGQYGQGGATGVMSPAEADAYRATQVRRAREELDLFNFTQTQKLKIYTDFLYKVNDAEVRTGNEKGIGNESGSKSGKSGKAGNGVAFSPIEDNDLKLMEQEMKERLAWYKKILDEWVKDPEVQKSLELDLSLPDQPLSDEEAAKLAKSIQDAIDKAAREKRITKAIAELLKAAFESFKTIAENMVSILEMTANNYANKQIENINKTEKAELDSLDRRALSAKEKADERTKIELQAEARRKKIEEERVKDLQRAAKLQRAIDIAQIISNTAQGVTHAYTTGDPYTAGARALLAAAAGAAQLAKVFATPLPQYAKGRKGGPAELAIVSEQGQESRTDAKGNFSLLPKTKAVVSLQAGDTVHTAPETKAILRNRLQNAAYVSLAKSGDSVTTELYGQALIDAFDSGIDKLDKTIRNQKHGWNIYADSSFPIRVAKRIR